MNKLKKKISDIAGRKKYKHISIDSKSASALAAACSALLPSRVSLKSLRRTDTRIVQNFQLIWLDSNIDELINIDCRNIIIRLRQIVNSVNTFIEIDECVDFIADIKEEEVFIIVSGALGQTMIPLVHDMPKVSSIYILCENTLDYEKWPKVKGVFMEMSSIYEVLEQAARECDQNNIAMSFIESPDLDLDELNHSFIYTQILKEIILTIDVEQQSMKDFIIYCRKQFVGNVAQLRNIDKLEREYHQHEPIWWYTYQCFLYSMLNRAFCTMEIDMIIKMSFFVHDLHQHIAQLHSKQYANHHHSTPFTVYRGQGMSSINFDQLKKSQGGLLSFNNFLSTNKNREISLDFAQQTISTSDQVGVLFVMKIDPSVASIPFANIRDVGNHQTEEEILFSLHSIFHIVQMKEIDNNIWEVELILTSDNDPRLHALTERIREETFSHKKGWNRLSEVLIKLGQLNKAQEVCDELISQTADDNEKGCFYHQLGLIKFSQGEYAEANTNYNLSLEIRRKTLPSEHVDVAACYNDIGLVYEKMGEYTKALYSLEKALEIYQKTLPVDHPSLAISNYNIGRVYVQQDEYSTALLYFEKTLAIYQQTSPPNYFDTAATYNSIGSVYEKMGEYSKALSSLEKCLEIHQKSLPSNLADAYNNIGTVYKKMCEYSKALSYHEQAVEISLSLNHLDLATSYNNIGLVYFQIGDYTKTLSYYEKAHRIYQRTLPPDHPHLAASYVCHGAVYDKMHEYPQALLYYKKALEIYEKSLPLNHPDVATSYNNIGSVYEKMGEYSTALLCNEKALGIYERTCPQNHPSLANSYTWHGHLYEKMGNQSKALLFYEHGLQIGRRTLHENHPCLQLWQNNIQTIKTKI